MTRRSFGAILFLNLHYRNSAQTLPDPKTRSFPDSLGFSMGRLARKHEKLYLHNEVGNEEETCGCLCFCSVSPRFDVLSHKRLPTARNGHSMTTQLVTPATTQGMVGGGWGSIMLGTLRGHWVLHAAKPQGRLPCLQESTESDEGSISVLIFEIV